LPLLKFQPLYI